MKNKIQEIYEETLLINEFKKFILDGLKKNINKNNGDYFWIGRASSFINCYLNSLNSQKMQNINKIQFLFDFSINAIFSNLILFNNKELEIYLKDIPGSSDILLKEIENNKKYFNKFIFLLSEYEVTLEDVFFTSIAKDTEILFNLNGIDLLKIRDIYFLRADSIPFIDNHKNKTLLNQHGYITMQISESSIDFFKNKNHLTLKSLISRETKHYISSKINGYGNEYLNFCTENEINPFNFKNEDMETIIDLNFQL